MTPLRGTTWLDQRRTPITALCPVCGEPFVALSTTVVYCGPRCRYRHHRTAILARKRAYYQAHAHQRRAYQRRYYAQRRASARKETSVVNGSDAIAATIAAIDRAISHLDDADFSTGDGPTHGVGWDVLKKEMWCRRQLARIRQAVRTLEATYDEERANDEERHASGRSCRCEGTDNTKCPIHTVAHYHVEGCCAEPEAAHRHMTGEEYDAAYPRLMLRSFVVDGITYTLEARRFPDADGLTFTRVFPSVGEGVDGPGLCWDADARVALDLVAALQEYVDRHAIGGRL